MRFPPLPHHQQSLREAGIHSGVLDVEYRPEPHFFRDQPHRYSFARLTLCRMGTPDAPHEESLCLKFQRHLLGQHENPSEENVSHPRFDYGALPWSSFYAPSVVPPPLPLPASTRLAHLARATASLEALLHANELVEAIHAASNECLLALYLDVLEDQGVTVQVFHFLDGGRWPEREVIASRQRFNAGVSARRARRPEECRHARRRLLLSGLAEEKSRLWWPP